jgi:histidyl-tRNA synthetase
VVYEHEIPSGSKLYFGNSAKLKREIENICSSLLEEYSFSEIATPLFSYHQQESFSNSRALIRVNDSANHEVSLRADSTVDVVRIVTKRLNRSADIKRWFYIQPIFTYPTNEQYQVGAEIIDGTFSEVANISLELLSKLELDATFQIANIAIAHILVDNYGFELDDIKNIRLQKILDSKEEWIKALVEIDSLDDLRDLSIYPKDIKDELEKIVEATKDINSKNIVVSPLYYAPMRYYNSLVFRAFRGNSLYLLGGIYKIKEINGAGFALYTDAVVSNKMQRV